MTLLLGKDLRILRRSPLLAVLLIVYPAVIAVLVGLALSRDPEKPRVAVLNELPAGGGQVTVAGTTVDTAEYAQALEDAITPVPVRTRAEAAQKVRDGDVLAAIVIPADLVERLQRAVSLSGSGPKPQVEVLYNASDPLQREAVESRIDARVADLEQAVQGKLVAVATDYIGILLRGGGFGILGKDFEVLGLERTKELVDGARGALPPDAPQGEDLERVSRFAQLAIDNLDLSDTVLDALREPIEVRRQLVDGRRTPLDTFAVAVAVALSILLVGVLLAAGMLALEREDHALARLVRGLVSRTGLVAEKIALGGLCALAGAVILTAGVSIFVPLDWGRAPWWLVAFAASGLACGALGVAIGALARDVRAASLLAVLLALPIAFLALIPDGALSGGLEDAASAVSALFPFSPAVDAIDAALNDAGGLGGAVAHLAVLVAGWGVLARLALGRTS